MIKFHTIRVKNFLSYGNAFTELDVTKTSTTLITATNGSGKSVWTDALTFGLFGKSFRKVNKNDLINSINGKNCVVELVFSIGSDVYKITRGMKPNNLFISLNGTELDHLSNVKDAQSFIEENILRMSYDAFTQIVILGSSSYTPFMSLAAKDRRNVIETIMDIAIFSDMNKLLKEDDKKITSALEISQTKLDGLRNSVETSKQHLQNIVAANREFLDEQERHLKNAEDTMYRYQQKVIEIQDKIKQDNTSDAIDAIERSIEEERQRIESYTAKIKEIKSDDSMNAGNAQEIATLEEMIKVLQSHIDALTAENAKIVQEHLSKEVDTEAYDKKFKTELAEINAKKRECSGKISEVKSSIRSCEKENDFLTNNTTCPVCQQEIADDFRADRSKNNEDLIAVAKQTIAKQEALVLELDTKEAEIENHQDRLKKFVENQTQARKMIAQNDSKMGDCSREIQKHQTTIQKLVSDKSEKQTLIMEEQDKISRCSNLIQVYQDKIDQVRNEKQGLMSQITELEKDIARYQASITETRKKVQNFKTSKAIENERQLREEIVTLIETGHKERDLFDELDHKKGIQEQAKLFLKDDGIKSFIIKKYIPVINHFVNKYLMEMGFFAQFEMNENFDEVIRNRFRDDFKYTSFSEGERKRIDLALLFTWRQIAKMKNSVDTNLLFLDEIFDSSLDAEGVDMFMGIVGCLEESNVFVISHKGEMLYDLFERVLSIEKVDNFSVVKELEV